MKIPKLISNDAWGIKEDKKCKWCNEILIDRYYNCDKEECVGKTIDELLNRNWKVYDRLAEI